MIANQLAQQLGLTPEILAEVKAINNQIEAPAVTDRELCILSEREYELVDPLLVGVGSLSIENLYRLAAMFPRLSYYRLEILVLAISKRGLF